MDIKETGLLLAKMSLVDNRTCSQETILAWQEILQDTEYEDALTALLTHWRTSPDYIRPYHIVEGAKVAKAERRKQVYGSIQ